LGEPMPHRSRTDDKGCSYLFHLDLQSFLKKYFGKSKDVFRNPKASGILVFLKQAKRL